MKEIWKFPLLGQESIIEIPEDAEILTVQMQNDFPCLWALVEPDKEKVKKKFTICGTGHKMDNTDRIYINTLQAGGLVLHVFEEIAW